MQKTFQLAEGDFPRLDEYKAALQLSDISSFPRIDRRVLNNLQEMLLKDIPRIISYVAGVINDGPGGNHLEDADEGDAEGALLSRTIVFIIDRFNRIIINYSVFITQFYYYF